MKTTIKNYTDAKNYLQGKKSRPYAHNTRIEIDSLDLGHDVITVTYHGNPVVNFFPDGTNTYNSCGWKTLTTKERIDWFLPDGFRIYQAKSVWYICNPGTNWDWSNAQRYIFADGIAIKDGQVFNAGQEDTSKAQIKAIKKFVDGYVKALLNGKVKSPSTGDCWYCAMQTNEGRNLGEATNNIKHITIHMKESYYVPSLLVNAAKFKNRMSIMSKDGVARLWDGESISEWQASVVARDVKSVLTAYLKHLLNIAQ